MLSLPKTLQRLLVSPSPKPPSNLTLKSHYVDVKMKWKKDPFYDSIDSINKTHLLKSLISLKNIISTGPYRCVPVSAISKLKYQLDTPTKVSVFLRQYPSFEEFTVPNHNLPWFRLTPEAARLDVEERALYRTHRPDLTLRLRKLLLMTKEKALPLDIIKGIQWYLGLPEDFLQDPEAHFDRSFEFVDLGDGVHGLRAIADSTAVGTTPEVSFLERKNSGDGGPIQFPLFPSKGLRMKKKIEDWLDGFQKLPYISPYRDFSDLDQQRRDSDVWEKRVVGVLHELLCLFVDHAAERRRLRCLRPYLGLPQKFGEAFVRHPHIFYLSLMEKTCTVVLKEAYAGGICRIEKHPIRKVRNKYVELMNRSRLMLKERRAGKIGGCVCSDGDVGPTVV